MTANFEQNSATTNHQSVAKQTLMQRPPWYYQAAIGVLKPLYRLQVWQRSHQNANYRDEVAARFGHHYPPTPQSGEKGVIWCHAVSLGETNTVAPLLEALLADGYRIWLTNTTQTGFARGESRFAKEIKSGKLSHSFVPVDSPKVIETFLAHVQPIAALFVETELWANILAVLAKRHIPSILVNGRLSMSSFTRYQKIAAVSKSMMDNLTLIIAQDAASAERFCNLGADRQKVVTAGSLKWVMPQANNDVKNAVQLPALPKDRPIWVAASTHDGEEQIALDFQRELLKLGIDALLILVPRHPERFDGVAKMIETGGFSMARRSHDAPVNAKTQVYLADSMGELMHWYQIADVALVGGSLVDVGGHNPVEPASVATPILMGKFTYSCQEVVDKLAEVGALFQPNNINYQPIHSEDSNIKSLSKNGSFNRTNFHDDQQSLLFEQLFTWLSQPTLAKLAGKAGETLAKSQQSALTDQLNFINQVLEPTS
ncbi:3-deoxy-D-manno-octulosonic acid transferase [Psychrobacter ciconiae]|uniref:3-deoxy-D-manno-octulosonic acid transferase n=1 Tax=Psychrobacter ciconiae TaxID=1553449 RepID=UPI00191B7E52|nr:3-deoxy-D-manno-octulosonic acid transferase [Psychrobacter ciconiae]